jgi:hypothetical protein
VAARREAVHVQGQVPSRVERADVRPYVLVTVGCHTLVFGTFVMSDRSRARLICARRAQQMFVPFFILKRNMVIQGEIFLVLGV